MFELTEELKKLGAPVNYFMSGGNCGTIYFGNADYEGNFPYAVGPSSYSDGIAHSEEICWGPDDDFSEANYFLWAEATPPTIKELAEEIFEDFNNHRMELAYSLGAELFWNKVFEIFPEAEAGDLSPQETEKFWKATSSAISEWYKSNLPAN